ncbi:MAG TPA: TIGR01906 family membrane protein, partial [Chloroflexota bacterium]|nr:TIGR01906 family membrane protein [Chloroflexota bacterium]
TAAPRVSAAPDALDLLRGLISLAFVVLVPLLLISTSLRGLVTDRALILRGFEDNRVDLTTGLDRPQLERVADAFVAYFQGPPGRLQMQVNVRGQPRPLFNEREVEHMQDVQALIQLFLRLQLVAAAAVVVRVLVAVGLDRSTVPIGRELLWSAGLVVALVALVGVLSLIDFTELWTRFHQIAFRNDLWQLDPNSDYLIMLFPEPFWYTATIRMAVTVALETIGVAILGLALAFVMPRAFPR